VGHHALPGERKAQCPPTRRGDVSEAILVYDDDCGFCTWWVEFVEARSSLRTVGFSELTDDLRERLPDGYEGCSHLLDGDEVYSCGASVEQVLVRSDPGREVRPLVEFLRRFEGYERVRERCYREVADRRGVLGGVLSRDPAARRRDGGE